MNDILPICIRNNDQLIPQYSWPLALSLSFSSFPAAVAAAFRSCNLRTEKEGLNAVYHVAIHVFLFSLLFWLENFLWNRLLKLFFFYLEWHVCIETDAFFNEQERGRDQRIWFWLWFFCLIWLSARLQHTSNIPKSTSMEMVFHFVKWLFCSIPISNQLRWSRLFSSHL